MKTIYVLAEHRNGHLRDTTWESIAAAKQLCEKTGAEPIALVLAAGAESVAGELAKECPKVIAMDSPHFEHFNAEAIRRALTAFLADKAPFVLLMGNSNSVMDVAPGLSVELDAALATDCIGFEAENGSIKALRQMYSYKVNSLVSFKGADKIVATIRGGSFSFTATGSANGSVETMDPAGLDEPLHRRFIGYQEAEKGDVDIAGAEIIVAIGRGIGDEEDLDMYQSLADTIGGVLACSRPIVDKNLLPKYHQVGTSGVEVKPKVYLALGISGAFQHLGGIKGNPLIIAVNKDAKAPIFRVAQYGVVADISEVVPVLEEKINEIKG